MTLMVKPGAAWEDTYAQCVAAAPEAFDADRPRNLIAGEWRRTGQERPHISPVDGSAITGLCAVDPATARDAVAAAVAEHRSWSVTDLDERRRMVTEAVEAMEAHRDLLARLLMWEIGKPWRLARADVDRALDGARWYVEQIERQLGTGGGRKPLAGPVSNIASWNYPMSVQVHAELVQLLAGNAVVAKTPSQGGFHCLTLAHALMRRTGLPVSLLSGDGASIGQELVGGDGIGALAFVGGRTNGRLAIAALARTSRRHVIEQEGLNAWGVWDFSDWASLAAHLRKGFEYAKQRCTAYPRYVVQRRLMPAFVDMYLEVSASIAFGHPLAVESAGDDFPELDYGPLISRGKASALEDALEEGLSLGAIPLVRRSVEEGRFVDGQDTGAYVAPAAVLAPTASWSLFHREPFGPLDSIVVVDTEPELIAAMNASNGALVASVATDDLDFGSRVAEQLLAFKVGINRPRSRGDREETFGGRGASWRGAFVGGDLLVQAMTDRADGADDALYGNFPSHSLYPEGQTWLAGAP